MSDTRPSIYADQALTPDGWRQNVLIEIGEDGKIRRVQTEKPRPNDGSTVFTSTLIPGVVNLHSHSFQRAFAGLTESRGEGSNDSFWTWRRRMYDFLQVISPSDLQAVAELVQMEMLEAGFTSVCEFHYLHHQIGGVAYDNVAETSQRIVSAAMNTGIGLIHLPVLYMQASTSGRNLEKEQLRFGCTLDQFHDITSGVSEIIKDAPPDFASGIAPHSLRAVPPSALETLLKQHQHEPVHLHIAEQKAEVLEFEEAYTARPMEWLLANFPVDQRWCAVHATHVTDGELRQLASTGAVVGLCPITEANLGDGIFNIPLFLHNAGIIGIGSDSNVLVSLQEELRLLEYSQRLQLQKRVVIAEQGASNGRKLLAEALTGGNRAAKRDGGKIAPGCWADIVALDTDNHLLGGLLADTVIDAWIFAAGERLVHDVWSAGRHVVAGGHHINRERILKRYRNTMSRLKDKL
jgi:formimidoylglutamate deiminase